MQRFWRRPLVGKVMLLFACLAVILGGIRVLTAGGIAYRNYWGGVIFAPLGICVGVLGIVITIGRWNHLMEKPPKLKGKAARLARQADKHLYSIDTFEKPWNHR